MGTQRQNELKHMNAKTRLLALVGLMAFAIAGYTQTNDSAGAAAPTAPAAESAAPATTSPPAQAATPAASTETAAPASANAASSASVSLPAGTIIPLIVMDEVPLTDAIKNLARQAGLNYMLDPKLAIGQLGADGKPGPQPMVSIRWEKVSANQALAALLNNYNLQIVEDPKTKISRVTDKDPAAPEPLFTKVIQLKYASPSNLVATVQNTLVDKRSKVVMDARTSQLVVLATEKEMSDVDKLIERLDTQTKQVLIEARLLETSINPKTSKGIDWSGTLQAQNISYGNGVMSGNTATTIPGASSTKTTTLPGGRTVTTTTSPSSTVVSTLNTILGNGGFSANTANGLSPNIGFLNADGVKAVLSFLNTYTESKVLSSPRTVTLDNTPATIEAGQQYPIINVTAGTANTTGGSSISYSNLTVKLDVTPRISANNLVNLRVSPKVLRLADTPTVVVGGQSYQTYVFDTRTMETSVMIPSGNTLVMGGLIQDDVRKSNTKVPMLGDIPGLGALFRTDTKARQRNNLTVFITPTIIQDFDFQPTKTDFLKVPVPITDSVDGDWSSWDSGKPKDWRQPKSTTAATSGVFDENLVKPASQPAKPSPFDENLIKPNATSGTNAPAKS